MDTHRPHLKDTEPLRGTERQPPVRFYLTTILEVETDGVRRKIMEHEARLRPEHVPPEVQRLVRAVKW